MQRNFRRVAALIAACVLSWSAPVQAQIRKLGPVFQVNSTLSPNAQDPAVDGNQYGFAVVWASGESSIPGQRFDAAGERVGPEFAIGDSPGGYQAISIDAQGGFLVAWDEWVDDQHRNFVQRFNEMGKPLGNRTPIGDSRAHSPAFVQDLAGGFGVFWVQRSDEQDDPYFRLFGEWFSHEGIPRGGPFVIAEGEMYCDPWEGCYDQVSGPAVARDSAGNFVVTWSEYPWVFGLRFNPEGLAQGSRFTIGEGFGRPSVEFRKNGNFQVVWTKLIDGGAYFGHEHAIFGRQFSPLGVPLSDSVLIQSSEPCSALAPQVRAQSGGGFMMVWYEQCDNSGSPVKSRALNSLGEPVGEVLELSRPTSTNQSPALSRVGNGDFIAVWQEWPNRIFGQRLQMLPDLAAINAGHSDAWYDPQTPGQGFFITVLPEAEKIFLAWFTFDTERPPAGITAALGDPGHRWLTALGDYSGTSAVLEVTLTSGGVFDAAHPAVTHTSPYGTITLEFSGCNELLLSYELPSAVRSGVIGLERISGENLTLCEVLNGR